ncbi:hypothetical protein C9I86_19485 [Photobacterium sp. NCIMB 13483]|nr:hypothetical protein C9I86_19485 [Photobacterium sp. NCIMB 13483]
MYYALILLIVYIFIMVLILLKPLFKYLFSLRGVKIVYENLKGEKSTKIIYLSESDPLYLALKSNREV